MLGTTTAYTSHIKIKSADHVARIIFITDDEGKQYSYFKNDGELEKKFEEKLIPGNEVDIFIKIKKMADGRVYNNLYPNAISRSNN